MRCKPTTPTAPILASAEKENCSKHNVITCLRHRLLSCAVLALAAFALTASARAQSSVTLGWNSVPASGIAGYRVYQGTGSKKYTSSINAGNATQAAIGNLANGVTYYFSVTAYTSGGMESDFSTEVSYTPTGGTNSPPPTNSTPPAITLTAPANGSSYAAPASIALAASVVTNGHSIAKVQFYQGTTLLGEDLTPPYSYTWPGVGAGSFSVSARLVYDGSLSISSGTSGVTVTNAPSQPPPPAGPGLVAAYGFEEGAGTSIADSSGAANGGTVQGATWTASGKFGKALSFNGSNSRVAINDSVSLHLTNGMTLEAWVYPATLGNWDEIIYKGDDQYFLEAATPATAGPSVGLGDTSAYPMLSAPSPLPMNTWTHVAGTYDGATLKIFINGVLAASRARTGSIGVSSFPLTIGADTLHGSYYNGVIDEVRIYNRALAASEIQTDMNSPVAGTVVTSTPPSVVLSSPAGGSSFLAPADISLAAAATANGHTISKVQFYNGTALLGEDTTAPYALTWSNAPAGNYSLTARITYDGSVTLASAPVSIAVLKLPLPWGSMDVGTVGATGSVVASNGVFTINGSGSFNSTSDNFQFLYQPLSGDGEISAQINSASGSYTVGAMIRESLTPNSIYSFMGARNGKERRQSRDTTGGATTSTSSSSARFPNVWVRLVRAGNVITRYQSADGVNWTVVDSYTVSMASEIYMGLAVASDGSTNRASAVFSNVKATP